MHAQKVIAVRQEKAESKKAKAQGKQASSATSTEAEGSSTSTGDKEEKHCKICELFFAKPEVCIHKEGWVAILGY